MKKIEVRLFGTPAILADGEPVSFPYRKVEGFLYYLCVKKSITREEAICLLWGDEAEADGRKKLRDAIYQVRKKLDKDLIRTSGHTGVSLNPDYPIVTDWNQGKKEPFLDYFYIKNCYEFEEWVGEMRAQQNRETVRLAAERLSKARKEGNIQEVRTYGALLIKEDPYNEEICHEVMSACAENGDYIMAIRLYYDLEKRLREEMGVEPSAKVRELFQRVFYMKEYRKTGSGPAELPFVGRTRELFLFGGLLERNSENPACGMLIVGEEGVGKTTLLENGLKLAAARKLSVLRASCYRRSEEFLLNSWGDILQELRQLGESGGLGSAVKPEDEALFSAVFKLGGADETDSQRLTYAMIERAVIRFFERLTDRYRVILAFDDIQWMDRMSLQLLNRLLSSIGDGRLLLACTCSRSREADVLAALEPLIRYDRLSVVDIGPFTEEETGEILHRVLPELDGEPEKRRAVFQATEGNAFFLGETINLIRKKGFTLEKSPKTNLAIRTRLSFADREEREILDCMSMFPGKIRIEELEYLLGGPDRLLLLKRLERLEEELLIQEMLVGWNVCYQFSHRLFQEYVYENQSNGKRLLYHRRLAEYYGGQAEQTFRSLSLAAWHFEKCHDMVRSYKYQIRYLKEFYTVMNENFPVLSGGSPEPGDDFGVMTGAERILELADQVIGLKDDSPEIRRMKMEMYYVKGRYDIAMGDYDTGVGAVRRSGELALLLDDNRTMLSCIRQEIFYGIQVGDTKLVESLVEQGLRNPESQRTEEYAALLRLQGLCSVQEGRYDEAEKALFQALRLFESLDHEVYGAGIAACYNYLGDRYRMERRYDEAMDYYEQARAVGEGVAQTNGMGQIYSNIGQVHFLRGQYKEAMEFLERARECLERNGYRWGLERTEGYLALVCLKTGDSDGARRHYERGRKISGKIRNPETGRVLSEAERLLSGAETGGGTEGPMGRTDGGA